MSATAISFTSPRIVRTTAAGAACVLMLAASGCDRITQRAGSSGEIEWARAALERNPQLEVVAIDRQTRVFTIRHRTTGEIEAVKLDALAAAPVAELKATAQQPAQAPSVPTAESQPQPPTATTAPSQPQVPTATTAQSHVQAPTPTTQPAATAPGSESASPQTREPTTPGTRRTAAAPAQSQAATHGKYKIERTNGQLRVSGPGVSIVSSSDTARSSPTGEGGLIPSEPIICEGPRMMQLDSRGILVDGDAIVARGGCELFITNSRIVATGTAIVIEDATVHVANSHIEGANGSFDASDRARVFVRGSTFEGIPRRAGVAMVQDQGGNRWR